MDVDSNIMMNEEGLQRTATTPEQKVNERSALPKSCRCVVCTEGSDQSQLALINYCRQGVANWGTLVEVMKAGNQAQVLEALKYFSKMLSIVEVLCLRAAIDSCIKIYCHRYF
jgi:hypothetical protein